MSKNRERNTKRDGKESSPNEERNKRSSGTNKSRGRKPARNSRHYDKQEEAFNNGTNDPAWYTRNNSLTTSASSLSFNTRIGTPLNAWSGADATRPRFAIPGVCGIHVAPTVGYTDSPNSPINLAANNLFTMITSGNSRNPGYEYTDLFMYIYSAAHAYSYLAWIKRLYGIANTYSMYNGYMPDELLKADGVDPESIKTNLGNLKYYINRFATSLTSFAVPSDIPIFDRYEQLFSYVYMDDDSIKASMYILTPQFFYAFDDTRSDGTSTKVVPVNDIESSALRTYDSIVAIGNVILDGLMKSQDTKVMQGDIIKFYSNLRMPSTIDESYQVIPVYDEEMLYQIHNANVMRPINAPALIQKVKEPTGSYIVCSPYLKNIVYASGDHGTNGGLNPSTRLMDLPINDPTPESVLTYSRFMCRAQHLTDGIDGNKIYVTDAGSEFIVGMKIRTITGNDSGHYAVNVETIYGTNYAIKTDAATLLLQPQHINTLNTFNLHPAVWYIAADKAYTDSTRTSDSMTKHPIFDFHNYSEMNFTDLQAMHETAMLSLLSFPLRPMNGTK